MTGWRWNVVRVLFFVSIALGGWLTLRGSEQEIVSAIGDISAVRLAASLALTFAGLVMTGWVWRVALQTLTPVEDRRTAQSVFFVGQLGKYIPGSVWSFGAQAVLAARAGMSRRAVVSATGLLLAVHVASGLLMAGLVGGPPRLESWMRVGLAVTGVSVLLPGVMRRLGARLASTPCAWSDSTSLAVSAAMVFIWTAYAASVALLAATSQRADLTVFLAAFALAYAAGILVPVAPAGLGAREVVFVGLVAPTLGTSRAVALAIVFRVIQTVADLLIAGSAMLWARHSAAGTRSSGDH